MSRSHAIRMDRRIDLEWLDAVAAQVAAGEDEASIRARLFDLLDEKVIGGNRSGTACHKTVGVLCGIWLNVSQEVMPFRDHAIVALPVVSPRERLALHWAMLVAGYPFFAGIVQSAGRLLSLQGNLALSQLTRRMRERWGDRSTVDRAVQRVMRSMVQWGVLADTEEQGVYVQASKRIAVNEDVAKILLEGLLLHEDRALPVRQTMRHPVLFPFDVVLNTYDLRRSSRFEVYRQGLDMDVVALVARPGR